MKSKAQGSLTVPYSSTSAMVEEARANAEKLTKNMGNIDTSNMSQADLMLTMQCNSLPPDMVANLSTCLQVFIMLTTVCITS